MSSRLAARTAVLCALGAIAGVAHADKRRVAVIDLSADPGASALRKALYAELINHWALGPLLDAQLDAALEGAFIDEDGPPLAEALKQRAAAEEHLAQFDYQGAEADAENGEQALVAVTPTAASAPYAELAFVLGETELYLKKPNEAARAFALVHRLEPMRRPDPARYVPEVVTAFEAAIAAKPQTVKLDIAGTGRVWIDGVEVGAAPGAFDVAAGQHLVQLTAPDRKTAGQRVEIDRDAAIDVPTEVASEELQVRRARRALADAPPEAVARAGAMKQLAGLLAVHDAVLIWKTADGALEVQTWRDRAPGFSALREHGSEPPLELLEPLSPPRPPEVTPPPLPPVHGPENEPAWYRRRPIQATVAGALVVAVVGILLWENRTRDERLGQNPQFLTVEPPR
ncbi:MAG TPA: hypothetical protein VLX92_01315 [Kofleriaceae bacterium]|nr:hypothetical protein [Kofleriaceae bacterium]